MTGLCTVLPAMTSPARYSMTPPPHMRWLFFVLAIFMVGVQSRPSLAQTAPLPPAQTVRFPSADGRTDLTGYLFSPSGAGPHPAIVMLHGRAGLYSGRVSSQCTLVAPGIPSPCDGDTLSQRHLAWTAYWIARGYLVLHVDSFGPRGVAHGFGRHTHGAPDRDEVNELTVRPLDAEGALAWLAARQEVNPARIMLQGWSNGASTALNVMQRQADRAAGSPAFAAALVFYPGCGRQALLSRTPALDRPVQVLLGGADEEVSPTTCQRVLQRVLRIRQARAPVVTVYPGATHDFDDPGRARQAIGANRQAREDALARLGDWLDRVPSLP